MDTKVTLKWRPRTACRPGFHLYDDLLDSLWAAQTRTEPPVHLRLQGVAVELQSITSADGADLTVTLPSELARQLGLIPAKASEQP